MSGRSHSAPHYYVLGLQPSPLLSLWWLFIVFFLLVGVGVLYYCIHILTLPLSKIQTTPLIGNIYQLFVRRRCLRELRLLEGRWKRSDAQHRSCYRELGHVVRRFIASRTTIPTDVFTAGEIEEYSPIVGKLLREIEKGAFSEYHTDTFQELVSMTRGLFRQWDAVKIERQE